MYNSPTTPSGTTSPLSPNTYTLVFVIPRPIGMPRAPSSTSPISYVHVNVVPSVGPYPFINLVPFTSSFTFLMCFTDNASPPTSNCFNPLTAPASSSTTAFTKRAVSHIVVTPSSSIALLTLSTSGTLSSIRISLPPLNPATQISNVLASNVLLDP